MLLNFLKNLFKKRPKDEFTEAYSNITKNTTKSLEAYHHWEYEKVRETYNNLMMLYNQLKNEVDLGHKSLEADCDIIKYYITMLNAWDFIGTNNQKTRLQTLYCANDVYEIANKNLKAFNAGKK